MPRIYRTTRLLQEQSGSYFVVLPIVYIVTLGLKERDVMELTWDFSDAIKLKPEEKA